MRHFITIAVKDIRLLWRDRTALLLLFCMPALLALIITLVQQNVFETAHGGAIHGILVNQDHSDLADFIEQELVTRPGIVLMRWQDSSKDALEILETGSYQFCILIPKGAWSSMEMAAKQAIAQRWAVQKYSHEVIYDAAEVSDNFSFQPKLSVYFDPTLGGGSKMAIKNSLNQIILGLEMRMKLMFFAHFLKLDIGTPGGQSDNILLSQIEALPELVTPSPDLLRVEISMARRAGFDVLPTATQQTLPAMAVFGMFFIVVPLAGALVRERRSGIFMRLAIAPVSAASISAARLLAYCLVCLCQFGLILLVGKTLLPWLGGAPLVIGSKLIPMLLIVACIALAACGSGLLLGVLSRTTEQAAAIGPIAVVISAALGGIMVPVFVMPPMMQTLSRFSPLEWGHRALLDVLVRGADLQMVWPRMTLLLLFFAVTLLISRSFYRRN